MFEHSDSPPKVIDAMPPGIRQAVQDARSTRRADTIQIACTMLSAWCDELRGRQRSGYSFVRGQLLDAATALYDELVRLRIEVCGEGRT